MVVDMKWSVGLNIEERTCVPKSWLNHNEDVVPEQCTACQRHHCKALYVPAHLIITTTLGSKYYHYPLFADEATKEQKRQAAARGHTAEPR